MAITQWCSTAARRMMMMAIEQRMSYSSLASPSAAPMGGPILCGRGDKRTKKGKRFKDSYGNSRPKKEKKIERIKDKVEVPRHCDTYVVQRNECACSYGTCNTTYRTSSEEGESCIFYNPELIGCSHRP